MHLQGYQDFKHLKAGEIRVQNNLHIPQKGNGVCSDICDHMMFIGSIDWNENMSFLGLKSASILKRNFTCVSNLMDL